MSSRNLIILLVFLAVGVLVCFTLIFPMLYEPAGLDGPPVSETPAKGTDESAAPGTSGKVLPALTGVRWNSAEPSGTRPAAASKPKAPAPALSSDTIEEPALASEGADMPDAAVANAADAEMPEPLLVVRSWRWYEQDGYAVVEGSVRNVSEGALASLRVLVSFEDGKMNVLAREYALLELDPLFPGQTSPFSVAVRFDPAMSEAVIDFQRFSGGRVPWRLAGE